MNEYDFAESIMPLENMFENLEPRKKLEYFKMFRHVSIANLKDAVRWLMRKHTYKRFPLPAEIEEAIREIDADRSFATAEDLDCLGPKCDMCGGTGWKLIEREERIYPNERKREMKHDFAQFCSCQKGQSMRRVQMKGENPARRQYQNILPPGEDGLFNQLEETRGRIKMLEGSVGDKEEKNGA